MMKIAKLILTPCRTLSHPIPSLMVFRTHWALGPKRESQYIKFIPKELIGSFDTLFQELTLQQWTWWKKIMAFNPAKRLKAEEALQHSYLQGLHDPDDEVSFKIFNKCNSFIVCLKNTEALFLFSVRRLVQL